MVLLKYQPRRAWNKRGNLRSSKSRGSICIDEEEKTATVW